MEVVVVPTKKDGSEIVGGAIADLLTRNPPAVHHSVSTTILSGATTMRG
jgi:hypothetical protein